MWRFFITLLLTSCLSKTPAYADPAAQPKTVAEPVEIPRTVLVAILVSPLLLLIFWLRERDALLREKDARREDQQQATSAIYDTAQSVREAIEVLARHTETTSKEAIEFRARLDRIDEKITPILSIGTQIAMQKASSDNLREAVEELSKDLQAAKTWAQGGR